MAARGRSAEWAVITKDTRIRYRQTELAALVAGGVRAFVLTRGDLSGSEMAAILVKALPHLARFPARHEPPLHRPDRDLRQDTDDLQAAARITLAGVVAVTSTAKTGRLRPSGVTTRR